MASLTSLPVEIMFHMMQYLDVMSLLNFCTIFKQFKYTKHVATCFVQAFLRQDVGNMRPLTKEPFFATLCLHSQNLANYPLLVPEMMKMLRHYPSKDICIRCFLIAVTQHKNYPKLDFDIDPSLTSCSSIIDVLEYLNYQTVDLKTVQRCTPDACLVKNKFNHTYVGASPLHLAIHYDRVDVVKFLLDYGHSINIKDYDHRFPHQLCRNEDMLQVLADYGLISRYFIYYVKIMAETVTCPSQTDNKLSHFLFSNANVTKRYKIWLMQSCFRDQLTPLHGDDDDSDDD